MTFIRVNKIDLKQDNNRQYGQSNGSILAYHRIVILVYI